MAAAWGRWLVVQVGEWVRGIQEAAIFAEHLRGSLRRLSYESRLLHARPSFIVSLPPGYGNQSAGTRRYPVVYLLHGCPGQPRDWLVKVDVHATIERLIGSGK